MRRWNFLANSYVELQDNGNMTFVGTIANEVNHMINKSLRDQGINLNDYPLEFFNECRIKMLEGIS